MAPKIIRNNETPDYLPPMRSQFNTAAPMPMPLPPKPKSDMRQMWDSVVTGIEPLFAMINQALGVTNSTTGRPWSQEDVDRSLLAAGIRPEQPKNLTDFMPHEMEEKMGMRFVKWDASMDTAYTDKPAGPKAPGM